MATRCKECETPYFPPRVDCLKCRKSSVEWIPIDGKGKLITFTEVHLAPPAFQQKTPYLLGVAELGEGLRVFAPISRELDRKELKPHLKVVLKPKRAGEKVYYELEKA